MFKRKYIFKGSIFHCYVSLLEGTCFGLGAKISNSRAVSSLLFFSGRIVKGQSRDARKSRKHCWWDRTCAPTYHTHPKRPQMKGIPSVGACTKGICWKILRGLSHEVEISHVYKTLRREKLPNLLEWVSWLYVSAARRFDCRTCWCYSCEDWQFPTRKRQIMFHVKYWDVYP